MNFQKSLVINSDQRRFVRLYRNTYREITKNYTYQVNDKYIKDIVEILHHAGTDPKERVEIEKEQEALRVLS
ncbi:MAG: hypothetical protein AB2L24_13365 [Mangrovibacterium sp.]